MKTQLTLAATLAISCAKPSPTVEVDAPAAESAVARVAIEGCPELEPLPSGSTQRVLAQICAATRYEGFAAGFSGRPSRLRWALECVKDELALDQVVALTRAPSAATRAYARRLLHERRAWTRELVEEALADDTIAPAAEGCTVHQVEGWVDGVAGLELMAGEDWADAMLGQLIQDEIEVLRAMPPAPKVTMADIEDGTALLPAGPQPQARGPILARLVSGVGRNIDLEPQWLIAVHQDEGLGRMLRAAALLALGQRGDPRVLDLAQAVLEEDVDWRVKTGALLALEAMGTDAAWQIAASFVEDSNDYDARPARRLGVRLGDPDAVARVERHESLSMSALLVAEDALFEAHAQWALCNHTYLDGDNQRLVARLLEWDEDQRCALVSAVWEQRVDGCQAFHANTAGYPELGEGCGPGVEQTLAPWTGSAFGPDYCETL